MLARIRSWALTTRIGILLGASVAVMVLTPIVVMAQDGGGNSVAPKGDVFPAYLGYAAIGLATVVWGTMSTVVGKLYYGRDADRAAHQAEIKALKQENQDRIDALKKECKDEIDRLRNRLEFELKERREEAEKLLREQKDIMREVMTTCAATNGALKTNSEAVDRLRETMKEGEP